MCCHASISKCTQLSSRNAGNRACSSSGSRPCTLQSEGRNCTSRSAWCLVAWLHGCTAWLWTLQHVQHASRWKACAGSCSMCRAAESARTSQSCGWSIMQSEHTVCLQLQLDRSHVRVGRLEVRTIPTSRAIGHESSEHCDGTLPFPSPQVCAAVWTALAHSAGHLHGGCLRPRAAVVHARGAAAARQPGQRGGVRGV